MKNFEKKCFHGMIYATIWKDTISRRTEGLLEIKSGVTIS